MARLQFFLTILLLLPLISLAVVPAQVPPNGKGYGFTSNIGNLYPKPTGDWLTSTLCYCHSPVRVQEDWKYEKAHIFQHEYYNYHSNATYIVDHICLSRARTEGDQCVRPNVGGDNDDWLMEKRFVCKKFQRTEEEKIRQAHSKRSTRREKRNAPHWTTPPLCWKNCAFGPFAPDPEEKSSHPDHDKVCFAVDTDFYGMNKMELKFNRQRRKMAKEGDQGRVKTGYHEVQGYCEDMCQNMFNMPADMDINDKRADGGSRQYIYTQLDDMCDNCK